MAALLGGVAAMVVGEIAHPFAARLPRPTAPAAVPAGARGTAIAAALVVAGALAPPLVLLGILAWFGGRALRHRQARQRLERDVRRALPDLVDLLRLATTAGLSLPVAHPIVAPHVPAPIGPALVHADDLAERGRPRADVLLEALAPFGDRAHALAHVLGDHLRYGVPLLPGLERTGLELRLDRRRAAEHDARRVPVRLLAPLVTSVLPAFALLTVVPLLAASLEALPV